MHGTQKHIDIHIYIYVYVCSFIYTHITYTHVQALYAIRRRSLCTKKTKHSLTEASARYRLLQIHRVTRGRTPWFEPPLIATYATDERLHITQADVFTKLKLSLQIAKIDHFTPHSTMTSHNAG